MRQNCMKVLAELDKPSRHPLQALRDNVVAFLGAVG